MIAAMVASWCFDPELIKRMSIEEKVGQVLMVQFRGHTLNDDARRLVQELNVGGIIYYTWSNGLTCPEQIKTLSTDLQKLAHKTPHSIPLLIAADQEGGIVARLQEGFTIFPGNRALGQTCDPLFAKAASMAMGEELMAVGINMNLAPVVDINTQPKNPVIGLRSFGDLPQTVATFGAHALEGFRAAGVIATLKHFPGHGDTLTDSHDDLPLLSKSKQELERVELLPFSQLSPYAEAIMTAHILVPDFDPHNCSTLSERTLTYLRKKIGFEGVIVSDSLVMSGVLKQCKSVDEAAIRALDAGCDLLILGGKRLEGEKAGSELSVSEVAEVHKSIVEAIKSGRLQQEKLDRSVQRLFKLKTRYLNQELADSIWVDLDAKVCEHRALAKKIASCALEVVVKKEGKSFGLNHQNIVVVGPEFLQSRLLHTGFSKLGQSTDFYLFKNLNPSDSEIEAAKTAVKEADVIVIGLCNATKNPGAALLAQQLIQIGKPVIVLVLGDPLDAELVLEADLIIKAFSSTVPSLQAICDYLSAL